MITTSGRRRSASATAPAPSEASPITRMCGGAGEREAQALADDLVVVDDQAGDLFGHRRRSVCRGSDASHSQRKLRRLRRRRELTRRRSRMPCARAARATCSRTGSTVARGRYAPPRVELLVALELLGPVARERLEEVLPRARARGRAGSPRCPSRPPRAPRLTTVGELLGPVGEPGQDRRHPDARLDAGVDELARAPAAAAAAAPCRARSSARPPRRASAPRT